jgi:hypothetical protein
MRIKRFTAECQVSHLALADATFDLWGMVREDLEQHLSGDLRGPRGGRYVPVGDITHIEPGQTTDDFMHGTLSFRACRMGRYVRPNR